MSMCNTKLVILALQITYFLPISGAPFLNFLFGCTISFMCPATAAVDQVSDNANYNLINISADNY